MDDVPRLLMPSTRPDHRRHCLLNSLNLAVVGLLKHEGYKDHEISFEVVRRMFGETRTNIHQFALRSLLEEYRQRQFWRPGWMRASRRQYPIQKLLGAALE